LVLSLEVAGCRHHIAVKVTIIVLSAPETAYVQLVQLLRWLHLFGAT
jgi:hypothetical protein